MDRWTNITHFKPKQRHWYYYLMDAFRNYTPFKP